MKQSILILIVLGGLLLAGCSKSSSVKQVAPRTGPPKNDTEFAKEVFQLLADGDLSVKDLIDWERLSMLGVDVGKMYTGIPDDGDARDRFLTGFINGYSNSYKKSGGRTDSATNWREQSRDGSNTIVVADGPGGKLLLMTVAHANGLQKISSLDMK